MKKLLIIFCIFVNFIFANSQISQAQDDCKAGNMSFCGALGTIYQVGYEPLGVKPDFAKALAFHAKACDGNIYSSCANLGIMYEKAQGVKQNFTKALYFHEKACNGGDKSGCQNLGSMHYNGKGTQEDKPKGAQFFKRACDVNSWVACGNFAIYQEEIVEDVNLAIEYFFKACELGRNDANAQNVPSNQVVWNSYCERLKNLSK